MENKYKLYFFILILLIISIPYSIALTGFGFDELKIPHLNIEESTTTTSITNTMYINYLSNDGTVTINSTRTNHYTTTWVGTWYILNKQVLLE